MANFRQVNSAIQKHLASKTLPVGTDFRAVRGVGYVYFIEAIGCPEVPSLMAHPTSTTTETMTRLCLEGINYALSEGER